MLKFFRLPFATTGDKTAVPDAVDSNGNVSYSQGYGFDYQRQKTDPAAKNIERDKMNQILFDITAAIAELQSQGAPDYITSALNGGTAYSYAQYAIVKYSGALYISLVAANTALPSDATKWALLPTPALLQQSAYMSANAAGTVDAITAAFTPAITALPAAPGTLSVFVRATGANTSTTPTFEADGTAAKTIVKGNNVALVAGDIAGAGHWLELQYDATLNKWVLQNPTHGFGGTPPQFDNTTKTATTAFVQRALGNYAGQISVSASRSLLASESGNIINAEGAITVTLPVSSGVPRAGASYQINNAGSGVVTVVAGAGDNLYGIGDGTPRSFVLRAGDSITVGYAGGTSWYAWGGLQLGASAAFGSSLASSGYQKLPSGLIIQWGVTGAVTTTTTPASLSVTLPIAFPNNIFPVVVTRASDVVASASPFTTECVSFASPTQFVITHSRSAGSGPNIWRWIAIGY